LALARIYLTGAVAIEHAGRVVDDRGLYGRQGRLAFVFLVAHRHQSISKDALIAAIWGFEPPPQIESAVGAILSKLRTALKSAGWSAEEAGIDVRAGTITIRLPEDTWIDVEAATNAIDEGEGALRRGEAASAWGLVNVVVSIARRPFLPDHDAPWIEARRVTMRGMLIRALECLSTISAANNEPSLAVQYAAEIVALEPFRETGYQQLMRMHAAAGNRAEALRVFANCRELLRDELGVSPSPRTEAVFLEILRDNASGA
jgi:SARP family transcriptional regulator, regulator of embCAB operon